MFQHFHLSALLSLGSVVCERGVQHLNWHFKTYKHFNTSGRRGRLRVCVCVCLKTFFLEGWFPSRLVNISLLTSSMCSLEKENGTFYFLQTSSVLSVRHSQISMSYENQEGVKRRRAARSIQSSHNNDWPATREEGNQGHKFEPSICGDRKWCCWYWFSDIAGGLLESGLNRKSVVQKHGC